MSCILSPHRCCCAGTSERIRYPLMKQASDHGVPAVIIEKPIAVESEDWKQIAELAAEKQKRSSSLTHNSTFIPKTLN